jgi:hypothetical protein
LPLVDVLLDHGADLTRRDNTGWTALRRACDAGYVDVMEVLLRRGADPAAPEGDGTSCIDWARKWGHGDTLALLLRYADTRK